MKPTLIYGGTFDPVHDGHLGSAKALIKKFDDARLVMIPCQIPPHRPQPAASPEDRYAMLALAVENERDLEADDCELKREGLSYTYDTLFSYRQAQGDTAPLYFVMGRDAWLTFMTWHRWQEFCDLVHIIVMARPDDDKNGDRVLPAELKNWAEQRHSDLNETMAIAAGSVCEVTLQQFPVSASMIRERVAARESISDLVPETVNRYIVSRHLYL